MDKGDIKGEAKSVLNPFKNVLVCGILFLEMRVGFELKNLLKISTKLFITCRINWNVKK